MKLLKAVLLAATLVAVAAPGLAEARGGHGGHFRGGGFRVGVGLGLAIGIPYYAASYYAPPYYAPYYGYAPYYDYAPAYVAPQPAKQPGNYWYFCPRANGYYPYVRECPGGWQQVPTQPPR